MDVSKLEDAELDEAVARIEDMPIAGVVNGQCFISNGQTPYVFRPSTTWDHGGPLIERERISVLAQVTTYSGIAVNRVERTWQAEIEGGARFDGATPLIAAMRAFVASKAGF